MYSKHFLCIVAAGLFACTTPSDFEHCAPNEVPQPGDAGPGPITWHQDVRQIVETKCMPCHEQGGIAPYEFTGFAETAAQMGLIRSVVDQDIMPPWLPAACCRELRDDRRLSPDEKATLLAWIDLGGQEGDPLASIAGDPPTSALSRVDFTVEMREPYTPEPRPGRVDDFRCFLLDWPHEEDVFVTGFNPLPGNRSVVHHLIIAVVSDRNARAAAQIEGSDGRPGIPCEGGFGTVPVSGVIGGSLLGSDFPPGLGHKVKGGSKILLNVHYSLESAAPFPDQTAIEFKVDPTASDFRSMAFANPMWLVGTGFKIEAGDPDARFRYEFEPSLYTRKKPVMLQSVTPHMHAFGSQVLVGIVRKDGTQDCLLEIPRWDFGWEEPYWFTDPVRLNPGDHIYLECHFDNSLQNQPFVDGAFLEPRDLAWGSDNQDMCAGFLSFTKVDE